MAGKADILRLSQLRKELQTLSLNSAGSNQQTNGSNSTTENTNASKREAIKNSIETILAAECLFCGEHMINNIDKPFIEDWDRANLDWQ